MTDFKVEYIGIACGPNGDVSVFDRARAHERVNEIQGDLQQHYRNRDLFILAYDPGYVLRGLTTMSSSAVVESIVKGGIVSAYEAMEASLISYFQPTYNIEFKNFPKSRPGWLQGDLYSLNGVSLRVSRIAATLVSDSSFNIPGARWTFGRLWSEAKAAQAVHFVDLPNLMSTEGNWL
ncbi:hypothetical protein GGE07_005958 [Sinorhizobium terangae]|uniref:Uncharacterized protein n=1 Tax=Sinorhizobium terangae TaxID=110322 RepID=A0A6N7LNE5_SINTE|nr:hypothetical protein [Sinorhizobium terangae]MBB4189276.1 hypothetical protein [Sinorhizobium terangae]MQX18204.1 hypothetical protein [Sinorhizobium terangae]